jgi:hypothetical protein
MNRSTPTEEEPSRSSDDRAAEILAERALFGLGDPERRELAALGVDPEADPRAIELELAAAEALIASGIALDTPMPSSLRKKVQAEAFRHFEKAHEQPSVAPNTTTGANVVELAPRNLATAGRRGGARRVLFFLAAAAAIVFVVMGVERSRNAARVAATTSLPEPTARVVSEILLDSGEPEGAKTYGSLRWERGGTTGVLDVRGLPAEEAGRKREVWISSGGKKEHVGDFSSGDAHVALRSAAPELDVEAWMITESLPSERVILTSRAQPDGSR